MADDPVADDPVAGGPVAGEGIGAATTERAGTGYGPTPLATGFGYDRWARLYPTLERLAFGDALQRARCAHVDALAAELPAGAPVLLLGEGNGRALAALRQRAPHVRPTVVDGSAAMLAALRRHPTWRRHPGPAPRLIHADLRVWRPDGRYRAVIGCFVLDLFERATLGELVPRIGAALEPGGAWLHVDFARPVGGWRRRRADLWLTLLYRAFGRATTMEARALAPAGPALASAGLRLERRRTLCGGLLTSALWRRPAGGTHPPKMLPNVN